MVEVPDELTFGLTILGCPLHCPDCHSSWSWDKSYPQKTINKENLDPLIHSYYTCILFFGGEWEPDFLETVQFLHTRYQLPVALYTGLDTQTAFTCPWINYLDYVKTGPYIKSCGGLRSPHTNQRMFKLDHGKIVREYKFYGSE